MTNPLAALTAALTPQIQSGKKLTFQRIDPEAKPYGEPLSVMFNPTDLSFSRAAVYADIAIPGLALPISQFIRGEAETLGIELIFDGTEDGMDETAVGVTGMVHAFHQFVQIEGARHATPLVRVSWGATFPGNAFSNATQPAGSFDARVLSVARKFTLFAPDGTPLRATVSIALKEYIPLVDQLALINPQSPDHTRTHVVMQGETLPLIAHDAYGDVQAWRVIADYNGISDVRQVAPGTVLLLPPTR
jgi:nucleoid-associated protein YgaU